jgi:hypothetical protein
VRAHHCCGITYVLPSCLCSNAPPTSLGNCVVIGRSQRYTVSHTFSVLGAHKNETIDVSTSKVQKWMLTHTSLIQFTSSQIKSLQSCSYYLPSSTISHPGFPFRLLYQPSFNHTPDVGIQTVTSTIRKL